METKDVQAIVNSINEGLAKQMVLTLAVQQLLRQLPSGPASEFARCLRQSTAEVLQSESHRYTPAMDAAATLQLAALLEAAGAPPKT